MTNSFTTVLVHQLDDSELAVEVDPTPEETDQASKLVFRATEVLREQFGLSMLLGSSRLTVELERGAPGGAVHFHGAPGSRLILCVDLSSPTAAPGLNDIFPRFATELQPKGTPGSEANEAALAEDIAAAQAGTALETLFDMGCRAVKVFRGFAAGADGEPEATVPYGFGGGAAHRSSPFAVQVVTECGCTFGADGGSAAEMLVEASGAVGEHMERKKRDRRDA